MRWNVESKNHVPEVTTKVQRLKFNLFKTMVSGEQRLQHLTEFQANFTTEVI